MPKPVSRVSDVRLKQVVFAASIRLLPQRPVLKVPFPGRGFD